MRGYPDWMAGLSVRARGTLLFLGCLRLEDAKKLSYRDFIRIPNCGRRTASELCEFLGVINTRNGTMTGNYSPWQPIATAPKDGTPIDLWCVRTHCHGNVEQVRKCNVSWGDIADQFSGVVFQGWRGITEVYEDNEPTHWMPLPEPPST